MPEPATKRQLGIARQIGEMLLASAGDSATRDRASKLLAVVANGQGVIESRLQFALRDVEIDDDARESLQKLVEDYYRPDGRGGRREGAGAKARTRSASLAPSTERWSMMTNVP